MDKNSSNMQLKVLYVELLSSRGKVFAGKAISVTSRNDVGEFDILSSHSNFISIVKDYVKIQLLDGSRRKYELKTGVIKCLNNEVRVYLDV